MYLCWQLNRRDSSIIFCFFLEILILSTRETTGRWKGKRIPHRALKPLLQKLNEHHHQLPVDPRRLLDTPRCKPEMQPIDGGYYWHNSIELCLRSFFENMTESCTASININIDGLPLYKNGTAQIWPILVNVSERPEIPPMIAGIFYGNNKPKRVEQFLAPFVEEMLPIIEQGVIIKEHKLTVKVRSIICDAPARAFVKGVVNFNSIHGCLKCCTIGEYSKELRTTIFPQTSAERRTNLGFRDRLYGKHHQDHKTHQDRKIIRTPIETPFLRLPIDMVEDFIVSDSLHLLHLGVMKKLLLTYRDGHKNIFKWSAKTLKEISKLLVQIKLPIEIHRSVRGMDYVNHWKASEFGSFLNYIGIVVLRHFLNEDHYKNFVRLFCANTICSTNYYQRFLPVAKVLFKEFIADYHDHFGSVTSNIHNLVHVVEEVETKGPLPSISTYPFENHLYQIKKTVRSGRLPLSQIINRMAEKDKLRYKNSHHNHVYPTFEEQSKTDSSIFLRISLSLHFTLRSNFTDKWFLTKQHQIIAMDFTKFDGIFGKQMITQNQNLFIDPIDSTCLNVFMINSAPTYDEQRIYQIDSILCKLVVVANGNDMTFIPMVHTLPTNMQM
ncbi:uncharacterized protein LOC134222280 [Armigeres subalbatus]|uniref:uncharacterized protein LOC134222280 n=1 Tax=Armigeres subalbatus TaxID=124917 RepID=UPI002ED13866